MHVRLDQAPLLPPPHPASLDEDTLMRDVEVRRSRSGGPGGQHRNRVETRVELLHKPTEVEAHAGERRSVRENRPVAIRRLRLALALAIRAPVPLGEIGSPLWRSRRRKNQISVNESHWDYPALLAEALDVVVATGLDTRKAALRLEVSGSQLLKLIAKHPPALVALNEARTERGKRALRPG